MECLGLTFWIIVISVYIVIGLVFPSPTIDLGSIYDFIEFVITSLIFLIVLSLIVNEDYDVLDFVWIILVVFGVCLRKYFDANESKNKCKDIYPHKRYRQF